MDIKNKIKKIGIDLGFDWVSVSPALPLEEERKHYQDWVAKGYGAELSYMLREFPRRWVPQDLLPEAKSVITFVVSYNSVFPPSLNTLSVNSPLQKGCQPKVDGVFTSTPFTKGELGRYGYGRVARYAWGKNYHIVIRKRLEEWVRIFSDAIGKKFKTKMLVDSAPFLERAYANRGDTGFIGKNTLWISRKYGSFVFLAEILIDLDVEGESPNDFKPSGRGELIPPYGLKMKDPCGSCKECLVACPTGALVNARELDAKKCISYWTIENRGEIPEEMRPGIGDWIFGCDICQEVCPYNGVRHQTKWKEFIPESGTGPFLSLIEILSIQTEAEFKKRFAESPILRAKRSGLVRNACVVCANQNFIEAIPQLSALSKNDPDPVVRSHALWALGKLTHPVYSLRSPTYSPASSAGSPPNKFGGDQVGGYHGLRDTPLCRGEREG